MLKQSQVISVFGVEIVHDVSLILWPHSVCLILMHPKSHWHISFSNESTNALLGSIYKVIKFLIPFDVCSKIDTNSSWELHFSNFGANVFSQENTDSTLYFHRRTGCFTLKNVENGLWVLMSQHSERWNQSSLYPSLLDTSPIDSCPWSLLESVASFSFDADMNHMKRSFQKK